MNIYSILFTGLGVWMDAQHIMYRSGVPIELVSEAPSIDELFVVRQDLAFMHHYGSLEVTHKGIEEAKVDNVNDKEDTEGQKEEESDSESKEDKTEATQNDKAQPAKEAVKAPAKGGIVIK